MGRTVNALRFWFVGLFGLGVTVIIYYVVVR